MKPKHTFRPMLEELENRLAPSSVVAPTIPPTAPCSTPAVTAIDNVHNNVLAPDSPAHPHIPCG